MRRFHILCVLAVFAAFLVPITQATYCSAPPTTPHGRHDGDVRHNFRVGHVITYRCFGGYKLVGDQQLTCTYGSRYYVFWKGDIPHCKRKTFLQIANSVANGVLLIFYPFLSVVISRDNDDREEATDSSSSDSSHSHSNSFSPKSKSVSNSPSIPERCPPLSHPKNGRVHVIGYYAGLYARYRCNRGYICDGITYRKCLKDGTWSGQEPKCLGEYVRC
jgi:hypothetical protein